VEQQLLRINKRDIINILILTLITAVIGTYIIVTTVLISRDGILYISRAQRFSEEPIKVIQQGIPPGYPVLIYLAHKATTLFFQASVYTWCYTAQSVSLLCRIISFIPLYFIGKILVGRRKTFWALFIIIFLPYPAVFGSDVLRDWPHILFLSVSLLFLLLGIRNQKWWFFALSGFISALGHTIRPECAQIVIYCILWMLIVLISARGKITRMKAFCLTLVLLVCFAVPTLSYVKIRGKILPIKLKKVFTVSSNFKNHSDTTVDVRKLSMVSYIGSSQKVVKAFINLIQEFSTNLHYYFLLPLIVGFSCYFRRLRKIIYTELFFVFSMVILYTIMMIMLSTKWGYISRRHCMPIVVFTIFFVPFGIEMLALWINRGILKGLERNLLFHVLIAIGLFICCIKLTRITPLRWEKEGYLVAAKWLEDNVSKNEKVAVPDRRITFYASRKGKRIVRKIPKKVTYVVNITKEANPKPVFNRPYREKFSVKLNNKGTNRRIIVYKLL
jgi:4-amino-4-deoxy-L-arabinose transferase-like glycosyltransferase